MKEFLKTIWAALFYYAVGGIAYLLLMMLFVWMAHWWWVFIILVGIGGISAFAGLAQMAGIAAIPLSKNWLGKILAILISAYLLCFSVHAVWTTDFSAEHAKEITVKIIATIVFILAYLPGAVVVFAPKEK